jgi:membrane protein DedA with SNARE-associated domain
VVVYVIVGLLVFAEDALFIGFLIPGETAAIVGGVAASRGNVGLTGMCTLVVMSAVLGDSVGYGIGARYGTRLLSTGAIRRQERRVNATRDLLARRGGPAVFLSRFVALLRAATPFLAGTSRMRYRTFLAYNAAGGLAWGAGSVLVGYVAGNSYMTIEKTFGRATALVGIAVVVAAVIAWRARARRRKRASRRPAEHQNQSHERPHLTAAVNRTEGNR